MHKTIRSISVFFIIAYLGFSLVACTVGDGKRIIRIAHNQSETHPTYLGLIAYKKYIEEKLGDKYDVQLFPNELLGSQVKTVELCQTGAIDFTVASNAILESFDNIYEIFNLPYLFDSEEHYYSVMEDDSLMKPIFESTESSGFEAVTWYDAGTRNFYTVKKAINIPEDLKGMKIRVQQSATNVKMMQLFNAAAAPMGFGEVAKYYSYNKHQMVPDILIGNLKFLTALNTEERQLFDKAAKISTEVQRREWSKAVEAAKKEAEKKMNVKFSYPDTEPFKERVLSLHQEVINANSKLPKIYEAIQNKGKELKGGVS